MKADDISYDQKEEFDRVVAHPLQTYKWGEFREKTGVKVIRRGFFDGGGLVSGFQLTIHPIPHTPWNIGYLPKGEMPDHTLIGELQKIGKEKKCIFIQLEPNQENSSETKTQMKSLGLSPSAHPLFTKFTFVLDLTPTPEDLLKQMHAKTRYNIKVAQKHGVEIIEDNSDEAFETYWRIMEETTKRQKFYAHGKIYHKKMWQTLCTTPDQSLKTKNQQLTAHLLLAKYTLTHHPDQKTTANDQRPLILAAWILFVFKDTLYYPYGASSSKYKETMASTLIMWEAIKFGKKLGLKKFDMWGALGGNPDTKDPWFGFHNFKSRFGAHHVEFVGSYDLVLNPLLYETYKIANIFRWPLLRIKKIFRK